MRKVQTYERFGGHLAAWLDGDIKRLVVLGPPGVGKSYGYRSALGNRPHHCFGGRLSPLELYKRLYDAPNLPVVLDDISSLLRDANFRDMLKAICDTSDVRIVRWGTTTPKLEGRATSFSCTSSVLIVLNKIPPSDADVEAVIDRCDVIEFRPTKAEIISRMRTLFPDDDVLIRLMEDLPAMPSLRTLIKAKDWERSQHLNLMEELLAECGVPEPVMKLVEIMETCPEKAWCGRYVQETGNTDRTYRRHKYIAEEILDCRRRSVR